MHQALRVDRRDGLVAVARWVRLERIGVCGVREWPPQQHSAGIPNNSSITQGPNNIQLARTAIHPQVLRFSCSCKDNLFCNQCYARMQLPASPGPLCIKGKVIPVTSTSLATSYTRAKMCLFSRRTGDSVNNSIAPASALAHCDYPRKSVESSQRNPNSRLLSLRNRNLQNVLHPGPRILGVLCD
jgi:hypothetical protein